MKQNIVLCGFMGSGKTVTGTLLAERLGFSFVDLDAYIETQQGMTVNEIFAKLGEPAFRQMETEAATELGRTERTVIACGGGTVLRPENVTALKQRGTLFYLQVSAETVLERLKNDTTRPLLAKDKANAVLTLLATREPIYQAAADHVIDSSGSKEAAADAILTIVSSQK